MTSAVELFASPFLDELVTFSGNNKNVGPRWAALHATLVETVLPARARYRAAVETMKIQSADMERRHADAVSQRAALAAQLVELDAAIATQHPAQRAEIDAAPAKVEAEANASLSEADIASVAAAIENYKAFSA